MTGVSPTPEASLQRAAAIGAEAGLFYVYCGNAPGGAGEIAAAPDWLVTRTPEAAEELETAEDEAALPVPLL